MHVRFLAPDVAIIHTRFHIDAQQGRIPGRGAGALVPDRLAGAVRLGDDRGNGVRYARACFPPWVCFGNRRPGRHRRRSLTLWDEGAVADAPPSGCARSTAPFGDASSNGFPPARMAKDYVAVYRSLLERPSISARETTSTDAADRVLEKSRMDMGRMVIEVAGLPKRVTFSKWVR